MQLAEVDYFKKILLNDCLGFLAGSYCPAQVNINRVTRCEFGSSCRDCWEQAITKSELSNEQLCKLQKYIEPVLKYHNLQLG